MGTPTKCHEQYDRMKRWYARFHKLDQGQQHDYPSDYYIDEIYAFFINCYHLKDWIKHDSAVAVLVQERVEGHIDANHSLKLCREICNSLKHLTLKTPKSLTFGKTTWGLDLGGQAPAIKVRCQVDTADGPKDAFQLATECVDAWDAFLSSNGLR